MSTENMQYNSQMDKLVISEYGRNIQNMIVKIKGEKDYIKRQQYAEAIVDLMHQMHPTDKHNPDSKTKLWHHLFKIADWDIHVTPPDGVTPTPDNTKITPEAVVYPDGIRKNRHYGKNVQILIDKAVKMEDSEKKEEFVMIIAAYMKLAYRTWNKEHFVSDDVIKQDLHKMSEGQISISEDDQINLSVSITNHNRRRKGGSNHKGRRNNNYRSNGRGSNRNNGRNRRR